MLRSQRAPLKVNVTETTGDKGRQDSLPWHSGKARSAAKLQVPLHGSLLHVGSFTIKLHLAKTCTVSPSTGASSTGESRGIFWGLRLRLVPDGLRASQLPLYNLRNPHSQDLCLVPRITSWPQVQYAPKMLSSGQSKYSLYRALYFGGRRQKGESDLSLALTSRISSQSCTYFKLLPQYQNVPFLWLYWNPQTTRTYSAKYVCPI